MSAETDREHATGPGCPPQAAVSQGRRRLLRGGLSAAPVIMTLASGPVSAGYCTTASAYGSMNPSGRRVNSTCGGRSPSAWCADFGHWPIDSNADFSAYFNPAIAGTNVTLKKVIDASKGYDPVARNCVAALLNASTSPPLTPASILSVAKARDIWFSYRNNGGIFEPSAGIQWTSAQIVEWIATTYSS